VTHTSPSNAYGKKESSPPLCLHGEVLSNGQLPLLYLSLGQEVQINDHRFVRKCALDWNLQSNSGYCVNFDSDK
jgi:hypothetical protein